MNFTYTEPKVPEDCTFKISPSSIEKFFTYPSIWYEEQVLQKQTFLGNTSTVLGTICHAIFHAVANKLPTSRSEVDYYLEQQLKIIPDLDVELIQSLYEPMAKVVIEEYLYKYPPKLTEFQISTQISKGIYIAGTVDNYTGTTVVDYKTVDKLPSSTSINFKHRIQLLAYAYAMRDKGLLVDSMRIVYAIRPTKTIGARCLVIEEPITDQLMYEAIQTFKLIADSIEFVRKYPEHTYLIFKSMKLKLNK